MKDTQKLTMVKAGYESPAMEITKFSCSDVITTSGKSDENQGEWDQQ